MKMAHWIEIVDTWILMALAAILTAMSVGSLILSIASPLTGNGTIAMSTLVFVAGFTITLAVQSVGQANGRWSPAIGLVLRVAWAGVLIWACWLQPDPWFRFVDPLELRGSWEDELRLQRIGDIVAFLLLTLPVLVFGITRFFFDAPVRNLHPADRSVIPWYLAGASLVSSAAVRLIPPTSQVIGLSGIVLLGVLVVVLFELARRSVSGNPYAMMAFGAIVVGAPLVAFWP